MVSTVVDQSKVNLEGRLELLPESEVKISHHTKNRIEMCLTGAIGFN